METNNTSVDVRDGQTGAEVSSDTAVIVDPAAQLASITAERDQLAAERAELHDRYLRRQAEFENFRRRVERESAEFKQYAASEAIQAMLPIIDDFERALKQESSDKEYQRGIELIYQRMMDALRKLGLEPISAAGQSFDPYIHQAVERVETEDADDHTVVEEFQRGYNFKGRLLRPAMVKVAVKPSSRS
ncbi:MAG TPA: nucleotide exchange factor GrpE [Bryobacteraceae bacterium]|jgi:molecular chaperone GrpE|nr:nucleotide exchange factor GrpE [Bryobacteraceae bacterium]